MKKAGKESSSAIMLCCGSLELENIILITCFLFPILRPFPLRICASSAASQSPTPHSTAPSTSTAGKTPSAVLPLPNSPRRLASLSTDMVFLYLANELILTVAENLNGRDLSALLNVNRRLKSLLTPLFVVQMIQEDGVEGALFGGIAIKCQSIVRTVLEREAGIEVVADMTNVVPSLPSNGGDDRLVKFIMDMNITLQVRSGDGTTITPLIWAIRNNRLGLMRVLVNNGFHVNTLPWGFSPSTPEPYRELLNSALLEAAGIGAEEAANILLQNSIDIDAEGPGSLRPLQKAVIGDHLGMVRLLLEKGANPTTCAYRFMPPYSSIDMALIKECAPMWTLMMRNRHVSVDFEDYTRRPALVIAAGAGDVDLVEFLLKKGADVTSKDVNGRTALHLAATGGFADVCQLLMDEDADTEASDHLQRTPLHVAAQYGPEAIQVLLAGGADVTAVEMHRMTPLHFAAKNMFASDADIKALIDNGAPMDVQDDSGKSAQMRLRAMTTPRCPRNRPSV